MSPSNPDVTGNCINHPEVAASARCHGCASPICPDCESRLPDGNAVCPTCANTPPVTVAVAPVGLRLAGAPPSLPPAVASEPPPVLRLVANRAVITPPPVNVYRPAGLQFKKCTQHAEVEASYVCRVCSEAICDLCAFKLPGGDRVCPRCVLAKPRKMSGGRKSLLVTAYILAVWNTLGMVLLASGALASKAEEAAMGILISVFIFIPTIVGLALGLSVFDKRLANPGSVWGAAIWNGILMGILILLFIIGNMR
jgi:hypothetical protein